jgi:hypothetical protein
MALLTLAMLKRDGQMFRIHEKIVWLKELNCFPVICEQKRLLCPLHCAVPLSHCSMCEYRSTKVLTHDKHKSREKSRMQSKEVSNRLFATSQLDAQSQGSLCRYLTANKSPLQHHEHDSAFTNLLRPPLFLKRAIYSHKHRTFPQHMQQDRTGY